MKHSKKLIAFIMALTMVLSAMTVMTFRIAAEDGIAGGEQAEAPALSIEFCNLDFKANVKIVYAVGAENIADRHNVQLLLWKALPAEYVKGTEDCVIEAAGTMTYSDESYIVYEFTELGAMNMVDYYYTVAYYPAEDVYSEPLKFSVLEYAYSILGKNGGEPYSDADFCAAMEAMLDYGAAMQVYNKYRTDALANGSFSYILAENATLSDGYTYGIFPVGVISFDIVALSCDFVRYREYREYANIKCCTKFAPKSHHIKRPFSSTNWNLSAIPYIEVLRHHNVIQNTILAH